MSLFDDTTIAVSPDMPDPLGDPLDCVIRSMDDQTRRCLIDQLDDAMATLTLKERIVIKLSYGFARADNLNQREAAEYLGLSQPTIHRLHRRALRKLRAFYGVGPGASGGHFYGVGPGASGGQHLSAVAKAPDQAQASEGTRQAA